MALPFDHLSLQAETSVFTFPEEDPCGQLEGLDGTLGIIGNAVRDRSNTLDVEKSFTRLVELKIGNTACKLVNGNVWRRGQNAPERESGDKWVQK